MDLTIRRKYIGRADERYVKEYSSRVARFDGGATRVPLLRGYAAITVFDKVIAPIYETENGVEICTCGDGFTELCFLPDGENWQMAITYDLNGNVVERYFDITLINSIDENGEPYCDDLFLDAALSPDGTVEILDEDELLEAFENGIITKGDYETAHRVLNELIEDKIIGTDFVEEMCERLMELFE